MKGAVSVACQRRVVGPVDRTEDISARAGELRPQRRRGQDTGTEEAGEDRVVLKTDLVEVIEAGDPGEITQITEALGCLRPWMLRATGDRADQGPGRSDRDAECRLGQRRADPGAAVDGIAAGILAHRTEGGDAFELDLIGQLVLCGQAVSHARKVAGRVEA